MKPAFHPLQAVIEKKCLVIRVGLETLAYATLPEIGGDDEIRVKNLEKFGKDIAKDLNGGSNFNFEKLNDLFMNSVLDIVESASDSLVFVDEDKDFSKYPTMDQRQAKING